MSDRAGAATCAQSAYLEQPIPEALGLTPGRALFQPSRGILWVACGNGTALGAGSRACAATAIAHVCGAAEAGVTKLKLENRNEVTAREFTAAYGEGTAVAFES